jgi:fatty acid desaturase
VTYSIPQKLNLLIIAVVSSSELSLLWLGSHAEPLTMWICAIAFSFLMLTNYALIHEATHGVLHENARCNRLLGMLLSWFFPTSFTLLRVTHIVHHCCNRTDHEMFDCYYPGDNKLVKWVQWYGLLLGIWAWLIPVGTIIFAFAPSVMHTFAFKRARTTAIMFDDFGPREINQIRAEVIVGIMFWWAMFEILSLSWTVVLAAFACFAFNWSTRQYVTHAFTPRSVRDGALNLRVGPFMRWILLQGHWDLVHHQNPHAPWTYLQKLARDSAPPESYWRQYFRQWKGPRLALEPAPRPLSKSSYQSM